MLLSVACCRARVAKLGTADMGRAARQAGASTSVRNTAQKQNALAMVVAV